MPEGQSRVNDVAAEVCDAFRQIGDFSYAIFPKDLAHALGDLNKAVLSQIRRCVDWEIEWTDARVAGGDKIRDEWREKCKGTTAATDTSSAPGV